MNLVIIGAGGLAREVYDLAMVCYSDNPNFSIKGFLSKSATNIEELGYPKILGSSENYEVEINDVFFCAIGDVRNRKKAVENILKKGGQFINLIHPTAIISPSAIIGTGVAIKAHTSIASDVCIGNFVYIQGSVIFGHDVIVGDFCHINSFSFFAGYVRIESLCTINVGAKLIQNILVEEGATVGIGSVVINKVKANTTVFGIPAKRIM